MSSWITLKPICAPTSSQRRSNSCRECLPPADKVYKRAVDRIEAEYVRSAVPWFVGFSGGKDSSAVLKLVYLMLRRCRGRKPVTVVYCDTGVEIPVVACQVRRTLARLRTEARRDGIPLRIRSARPASADTYFVRVIGRGYPPPTNKFRWCTDRLRIDPVRRVIDARANEPALVLLGTRTGESVERDRTLREHSLGGNFFVQSANPSVTVFAPIVDFTTADVWATLLQLKTPASLDGERLADLYREAGAECPIVRDAAGTPCGSGRFGCWTCTVVRQDKSVSSMIKEGHDDLAPLLAFRNWLAEMRDLPENRCRFRRNGVRGAGPLTLAARRKILRRLGEVQKKVPWRLLTVSEERRIRALWRQDRSALDYRE